METLFTIAWNTHVLHLQSQLMLARATLAANEAALQAKDAAIEFLAISNCQYRQLALAPKPSKVGEFPANIAGNSDKEPLIKDVVAVTKLTWHGLEVDLPTIVRKLKRRFLKGL